MTNPIKDPIFMLMLELEQDELQYFVTKSIINSEKNKTTILKYAHLLGCQLTIPFINAVKINDILSAALCLKYGASLDWKDANNCTLAHICASKGHYALLRSFILRGLPVNDKTLDGITPLQLALNKEHYQCAIELIDNNATLQWQFTSTNDDYIDFDSDEIDIFNDLMNELYATGDFHSADDSADNNLDDKLNCDYFNDIINNKDNHKDDSSDSEINDAYEENALNILLENYKPASLTLIKLVISKLQYLNEQNINQIRILIIKNQLDLVDLILSKFPDQINHVFKDNNTCLSILIINKHSDITTKYLRLLTTDLYPDIETPYIHRFAHTFDINNLEYLLEKDPNQIHNLCYNSRTPIDYILLFFSDKYESDVILTISFLASKGCNINNRNSFGFRTIETAIQYCSNNVIDLLINLGANIHDKIINENQYFPAIVNNDLIGFAAQIGNVQAIDLLRKHNVKINLYQRVPTAMILAIKCDQIKAVTYLMGIDEINTICNKNKEKLLDYSINIGMANKKIMLYFASEDYVKVLKPNAIRITLNNLEKELSIHIDDYEDHRDEILTTIRLLLFILMQCCIFESKDDMGIIINTWYKLYMHDDFIFIRDVFIHVIAINTIHANNYSVINECFNLIDCMSKVEDDELKNMTYEKLKVHQLILKNELKGIQKLIKIFNFGNNVNYENEKYTFCFATNDKNYIENILIKLRYPVLQSHYKSMYDKIAGCGCVLNETDSYISVCDNQTNITASILKVSGLAIPKKWFDFYSYNIGKNTKCDYAHMFPFILDKKLCTVPCFEQRYADNVNGFGCIRLMYFYGTLSRNSKTSFGVFEYFVDTTGTLFHRFFRQYERLSKKTRSLVMKNFPEKLKLKYNVK